MSASCEEVRAFLDCSRPHVHKLIERGDLVVTHTGKPGYGLGSRVTAESFVSYLRRLSNQMQSDAGKHKRLAGQIEAEMAKKRREEESQGGEPVS